MATWEIVSLEVKATPDSESRSDVVEIVHYAVFDNRSGHSVSAQGKKQLASPSDTFTEFADLTKDDVLAWIWADGNKEAVEAKLSAKLDALTNVDRVQKTLPWK